MDDLKEADDSNQRYNTEEPAQGHGKLDIERECGSSIHG